MNHRGTETQSINKLSSTIIGAAIGVHRVLGPGLLESAYEECLCYELALHGIRFERQKALPVIYKGVRLDCGYRLDVLVEDLVIIELKTVDRLENIHTAQLLTYLKLMKLPIGLLINFNVPVLKYGIKRVASEYYTQLDEEHDLDEILKRHYRTSSSRREQ
jgi:GxxExxY protein